MSELDIRKPKTKSRKRLGILPITFSCILGAGALAGAGVSIWQVSQKYQESAEFSKSVNARVEIDPFAFEEEQTDEIGRKNTEEAAKILSAWLKSSGQQHYDVSWEYYDSHEEGHDFIPSKAYLNARFNVDKIETKIRTSDDDEKIDNDPYLSIFNYKGFNTNNKSLVYRWFDRDSAGDEDYNVNFTVLDFDDIFDIPTNASSRDNQTKVLANSDGKWGTMFKIKQSDVLNDIYINMLDAYEYTQEDQPTNDKKTLEDYKKPRFYVIENLEGLLNEANYHILNYKNGKDKSDYRSIYKDSEYETFAEDYLTGTGDSAKEDRKETEFNAAASANLVKPTGLNEHEPDGKLPSGEVLRFIDFTPGTVKYQFMNKYVDQVIKLDSEDWKTYFPEKINDTYSNTIPSSTEEAIKDPSTIKLQYFWLPSASKDNAQKDLKTLCDYSMPAKIVNIDYSTKESSLAFEDFKESFLTVDVKPTFSETIFGNGNVVGWLSLGFLIYLVILGILLACLYRMTGFFSWICMMFMLSITGLIVLLSTSIISMSFLFGLFMVSTLGFLGAVAIGERMKKRLNCNEDTRVIIAKAFKKSLFPLIDISIIALVFGICFTYIAPMAMNAMGVSMIVGAFGIFIAMYLFNGLLHGLFFNNTIIDNKFILLGKPSNNANSALSQGNNLVPYDMDVGRLDFPYYSSACRKNVTMFGKETWISLIVLAGILVLGMILFGVLGFATNSLFHSSSVVCINWGENLLNEPWFKSSGLVWSKYVYYAAEGQAEGWWYFYGSGVDAATITKMVEEGGRVLGSTLYVQSVFGSTNADILNFTIISIIVSATVISLYSIIRFNWTSFVPMLVGTFAIPLLMLAVASICQVKFDEIVILGFVFISVINAVATTSILSAVQDAWSRKDAYSKSEFKFICATGLKNAWTNIWVTLVAYGAFIVCFGITAPLGSTIWIIILLLIGALVTTFAMPIAVTYILYLFLIIRNKALGNKAMKDANKVRINYDEIDEQEIEGLNHFTKVRPIPKIERIRDDKSGVNNEQSTPTNNK